MKWIFTILVSMSLSQVFAQGSDTVAARIILIGDAGELVNGKQPVIDGARRFMTIDEKTTVVFLGDNLYRYGLPDEQDEFYTQNRAVLDTQVALVNKTKAKAYFIPGNHDWRNGGPEGLATVIRQQRYIDRISRDN